MNVTRLQSNLFNHIICSYKYMYPGSYKEILFPDKIHYVGKNQCSVVSDVLYDYLLNTHNYNLPECSSMEYIVSKPINKDYALKHQLDCLGHCYLRFNIKNTPWIIDGTYRQFYNIDHCPDNILICEEKVLLNLPFIKNHPYNFYKENNKILHIIKKKKNLLLTIDI